MRIPVLFRFFIQATLVALAQAPVFAFDMGPLNQFLEPTSTGSWQLSDQDGAAIFDNRQTDGDITYYFVAPNPGEEGRREISVDVGILRSSGFSKAGLLYGFENDPRSYFMFTVDGEGTVRLEYRSPQGWEERMSSRPGRLDPNKIVLTIREDNDQISLLVNGQERSAIGNDRIGRGGVGIVAVGIGTYSFRDFDVAVGGAMPTQEDQTGSPGSGDKTVAASLLQKNTTGLSDTTSSKKAAVAGSLPDGVLHVRAAEIIDKHGFKEPVRAASLLIPADWKFEGTVQWVLDGCYKGTHIVYDAISPDNRSNLSLLPTTSVHWSQTGPLNNCTFLRAERAEELIQPVIDQVMQNVKIINTERSPELTEMNKRSLLQGTGYRTWMDHIIATVEHDRHGTRHRASVLLLTYHTQMVMPMLDGPSESLTAAATPLVFSAPIEQFEDHNLAQQLITSSYRMDPAWQARINKHHKTMTDDNRETSAKIAEINRKTNTEIAAINAGTQASISASNDRNYRRTLEMLTDTQTVQASAGPVRVPAGTVWQTGDGSMFVSQNPAFNPNSVGLTATKLKPIR